MARALILPQNRVGADTHHLAHTAPRLWRYLDAHRANFEARRSSIYRGKPPFSVFGVGDYSFAPYKVAISGLHKQPRFRAVAPLNDKPVLFDDTCYLLPFATPTKPPSAPPCSTRHRAWTS